jgi:16S rRNA (guanine527-N7)-methyltransferase
MSKFDVDEFIDGARSLGIEIDEKGLVKFERYLEILLLWNRRVNLVSKRDEGRIAKRHFLDSLSALSFIPENVRVLDIGSGAGFPGIPIRIVRNDITLDIVESRRKRCLFLRNLVSTLGLENISIYCARIEDFSGVYNVVLARSVGKLSWLIRVTSIFIENGGVLITYKGERLEKEMSDARPEESGFKIREIRDREFSRGKLVVLEKIAI